MNGAAMNCRQDQVLHSQHMDSRGLRDARYHLQLNHPCEQNFLPHHSKAINSQSDNFLVEGSAEYLQRLQTFDTTLPASENIQDPRDQVRWAQMRKPIDLPVPKFENDENCVNNPNSSHDNLDLDTRIDLLIKSKALAGMHPIFSELVSSEEDSDDSIIRRPKRVSMSKKRKSLSLSPVHTIVYENEDDDPDKPLSRPPSPFLSRATYLFWFNKAIEIKEQAKAQEQALLEKATKKLQDNLTSVKSNHVEKSVGENKSFFNCLLNEISKEMKDMIKQQFINEVLENTISNSLENWETEFVQQEQQKLLVEDHKTNPASMEQDKNVPDDNLVFGSSEKVVSDEMRSTSMDGVHSEHDEKLLNEVDNSLNQTSDKQQHCVSPNPNRCSTLIHPDSSNSVSIDSKVSKESLTSLPSVPLHVNSASQNKDDTLILVKKQDEDHFQDSSKANVEDIKPDLPVSTHIKSNMSLSQSQADSVTLQNLDAVDNSGSTDRDSQKLEENHPLKIVTDKSLLDIENSVIVDECSSNITSVPSHDKQNVIGTHQSHSTIDIGRIVINETSCQETLLTDSEVKLPVQEYPNPLNEEDTIVTKPNCEDAMDPVISSHN